MCCMNPGTHVCMCYPLYCTHGIINHVMISSATCMYLMFIIRICVQDIDHNCVCTKIVIVPLDHAHTHPLGQ